MAVNLRRALHRLNGRVRDSPHFTTLGTTTTGGSTSRDLRGRVRRVRLLSLGCRRRTNGNRSTSDTGVRSLRGRCSTLCRRVVGGRGVRTCSTTTSRVRRVTRCVDGVVNLFFSNRSPRAYRVPSRSYARGYSAYNNYR